MTKRFDQAEAPMKTYSLLVYTALLSAHLSTGCEGSESPRPGEGQVESPVGIGGGSASLDVGCNGCAFLDSLEDPSACPGAAELLQPIYDCGCGACPDCAFGGRPSPSSVIRRPMRRNALARPN